MVSPARCFGRRTTLSKENGIGQFREFWCSVDGRIVNFFSHGFSSGCFFLLVACPNNWQSLRAAASRLAVRGRGPAVALQRRNAQTVPKLGTEAEMQAEALQQIRARVAYQKELMKGKHGIEEDVHEMTRWIQLTFFVAIPISALSYIYSFVIDNEHPHRIEGELPEYMSIRSKEFPWAECDDCDLLDMECWKKCKAEKN